MQDADQLQVEPDRIEPAQRGGGPVIEPWPAWYRALLIALATCILCSCRGVSSDSFDMPVTAVAPHPDPAVIPVAGQTETVGHATAGACADGACAVATGGRAGTWRPPGLPCPWPADEYLCDGGDRELPASVHADGSVHGLGLEDTIAHYDTVDGRIVVEPTNRVCIYAPRFAAVRRVENPVVDAGRDQVLAVDQPLEPHRGADVLAANTTLQRDEPLGETRIRTGSLYRRRQQGGGLENEVRLAQVDDGLLPYENLKIFRLGVYDQREKTRLAEAVRAAIVWTGDQSVQVILDGKKATVAVRAQQPEVLYHIEEPDHPRLRVVKIASTSTARPGETVDFMIRYDNVGDQAIGNVTLLDNLSPRLQFVPGTARCSLPANFSAEANDAGSVVLRWDLKEPLEPGKGGTVRFRCTVR